MDAGFVGVQEKLLDQFANEKGFEWFEQDVGFLIEAEYRSGTDRDAALVPEVVADAVVRDQLLLRRVDGLNLDALSILHGPGHSGRKLSDELMAVGVLENLGVIFDNEFGDDDVDDLAHFITGVLVPAWRKGAPVDGDVFDLIGMVDRFQRRSGMSFLPAGLALTPFAFGFCSTLALWVLGRRNAAVGTVETQFCHKQLDNRDQQLDHRPHCRRDRWIVAKPFLDAGDRLGDVENPNNRARGFVISDLGISRHLLAWAETAPAGSVPAGLPDGPDLNLQDY